MCCEFDLTLDYRGSIILNDDSILHEPSADYIDDRGFFQGVASNKKAGINDYSTNLLGIKNRKKELQNKIKGYQYVS